MATSFGGFVIWSQLSLSRRKKTYRQLRERSEVERRRWAVRFQLSRVEAVCSRRGEELVRGTGPAAPGGTVASPVGVRLVYGHQSDGGGPPVCHLERRSDGRRGHRLRKIEVVNRITFHNLVCTQLHLKSCSSLFFNIIC